MVDKHEEVDFSRPEIESGSLPDPRSKLQNDTDIMLCAQNLPLPAGLRGVADFK